MPNSITSITADKYDDIASGEGVRVTLVYDADSEGIFLTADATTPGFEATVQPGKDWPGPVLIMLKGPGQMIDVWLTVKRSAGTAKNCVVAFRVGDSNPYDLPFGMRS
ncbi:MAG: hypothetical protein QM820_00230 [Minicystis sp.]